ncbi:hypothetical protein ACFVAJ_17945 [Agromyces sp. NPDC057679]|uniref:hypothetical protein n=1 Tax=Agromyces sp. NPDC057679 TaxID=3346207 RepID=UPI00366B66F7
MTAASIRPVTLTVPVQLRGQLDPDSAVVEVDLVLAGRQGQEELEAEIAGLRDSLDELLSETGLGWELIDETGADQYIVRAPGIARLKFIAAGHVDAVYYALRATGFLDSGDLVVDDILNASGTDPLDTAAPNLGVTVAEWEIQLAATPASDPQRNAIRRAAAQIAEEVAAGWAEIVGTEPFRITELVEHVAEDDSIAARGEDAESLLSMFDVPVEFNLLVDVTFEAQPAPVREAGAAHLTAVEPTEAA